MVKTTPKAADEGLKLSAEALRHLSPAERLRRLAAGVDLPSDRAWLQERAADYLAKARDGVTLDQALGLSVDRGGEPWWRTDDRRLRDAEIRSLCRFFPASSITAQAKAIEAALHRYGAIRWRRDRDLPVIPAGYAGTPNEGLFLVFCAGGGDLSARRIVAILGSTERAAK